MDTYANLKTALANWSNRDDLTSYLDDFIDIAESEASKVLRIREMEERATATMPTSDRFLALPANFLEMRHLQLNTTPRHDIRQTTPETLTEYGSNTAGKPRFFAVTSQLEFDRKSDSAYTAEMLYYRRFDALSGSNTSNWLTSNAPEILLYGSLWALFDFVMDQANADRYYAKFMSAMDNLNKSDKKGRFGPAPAVRTERKTP